MVALRRQMKQALRFLKNVYFTQNDKIKSSSAYEWTADNRLMLVSAIREMMKKDKKFRLEILYSSKTEKLKKYKENSYGYKNRMDAVLE